MFPHAIASLVEPPLVAARIESQEREEYSVLCFAPAGGEEHHRARLSGALRHAAHAAADLPAVGDYVALECAGGDSPGVLRAVLPRQNLFSRRSAGGVSDVQPIAANIDMVFITVACNRDFNLRRIERYLTGAEHCAVNAAVLLTKIDLVDDVAKYIASAERAARGRPVIACSALDGAGIDALAPFRGPFQTLAFVGSSGAGKSTLINALLGENRLETGAARTDDDRGRHTTTRRSLLWLDDGTAVIDTPGMREFGLRGGEETAGAFDDVAELAARCRFRDCSHEAEPGCAVVGELDPERLANWRKLTREVLFEARKTDRAMRRAEQNRWKAVTKAARAFDKRRPS